MVNIQLTPDEDDIEALKRTQKIKFLPQNTGLSLQQLEEAFGFLSPETIAELSVLGWKKHPWSRNEWKKLAEKVKSKTAQLLGK